MNMRLGNDWHLPVPVQAFLRNQGGGKAMILIVMDADNLPGCTPDHGMFVRGFMSLTLDDCRDPGDATGGLKPDQILTTSWDPEAMTRITPAPVSD